MLLCPSLMCADFLHLADEVDALCAAGADLLHLDVIDEIGRASCRERV